MGRTDRACVPLAPRGPSNGLREPSEERREDRPRPEEEEGWRAEKRRNRT